MTEQDLVEDESYDYEPGGKRRKSRGAKGCLAVIVALAVLVGGFYFGLTKGVSWVADQFQGPEDYPGPGTGKVEFTVNEGDVTAQIGRNLKAEGITASVQAFIDACGDECSGIQVGDYELQKEMKAAEKEAREAYASQKDAIEAKRRDTEAKLTALAEQRKTGAITQAEYEQQVAALAS